MNYDNMSSVLSWMAVYLGDQSTFVNVVKRAQDRVNKKVPRTHKHRLK